MLKRFRIALPLAVIGAIVMAQSAFATADADVVSAVTGSTTTLEDTISAALPLILGVTALMVVIRLAKRLLRSAG